MTSRILILLFFTYLQLISEALSCSDFTNGSNSSSQTMPKMKLRIDQPTKRHELSKFVHHLEPNIVLVNMTGILTLRLDCWAPFPIVLNFNGHLTNQETTIKMFRSEFGPSDNQQSCFHINATMESYEEINGNYSCVSVDDPKQFSSYYIFVSPTPPGVLLTRGQKINLQTKADNKEVVFPCAVSHPDVHVQLLKDGTRPVPISPELSYDPKIGFTMAIDRNDRSKFGSYTCQTELSPNDHVNITLKPPKDFQVRPSVSNIRLLPSEQLHVTCDFVDELIITTTPPNIPFVKNEVVLTKPDLSTATEPFYKYSGTFIAKYLPEKTTGYVTCKSKDNNKPFAEWSFQVMNKNTVKPGHLDMTKFKTECQSEMVPFECNNIVECKINSCLRKDARCKPNGALCLNDKSCMRSGVIQCPSHEGELVSEIFFTGFPVTSGANKTNTHRCFRYQFIIFDQDVEWNDTTIEELLQLKQVVSPYSNKNNEHLTFSCQGSSFVFSTGFKWFLVYRNGTRSELLATMKGNLMNVSVNNSWKEKKSILTSTLMLSMDKRNSKMTKDVTHVECLAPIWNSRKWIPLRIPITENMLYIGTSLKNSAHKISTGIVEIYLYFGTAVLIGCLKLLC